jgi:ATPase family protein associated with various cellular activities (AAA)/winged helix domain-containing protein
MESAESAEPTEVLEPLPKALDRVYESLSRAARSVGSRAQADDPAAPLILPAPPGSPAGSGQPWAELGRLTANFGLTPFERDVLVLLVGHSLQSRFAHACATALGILGTSAPTFAVAMAALDDPHWSALSSARPLRYWQLVNVDPGDLLDGPLRVDERILAYLMGMPAIDERVHPVIRPVRDTAMGTVASTADGGGPADQATVLAGARHWARGAALDEPLLLTGQGRFARERAFTDICRVSGLLPYAIDAADIPESPAEREQLARRWTREAALRGAALYIRTENTDLISKVPGFLRMVEAPVAVEVRPGSAAERLDGLRLQRRSMSAAERRELWVAGLGPLARQMDGYLDRIADYFQVDEPTIRRSAAAVREAAAGADADPGPLAWRICREHARRGMQALATRVEPTYGWDDLVLPEAQRDTLRQVVLHVRHRAIVNDQWGFAARHARGLGLTALFAGASGTGKTMAAEVIAADLDLDLYKIDLATVVSKYIGETEKNLREIFAAATETGAILLFDEADALFGKRSEVRDSHDRYANLEISYLLQQMEAYRGVAILTTNMQHALDPAFMRRIRFVVQFPFPDAEARTSIWRGIFPSATPVADLDFGRLAQLNVAGGVIRNIATLAAFLAAEDGGRVATRHVLAAVRTEYAKTDKPLTAAETRGLA